MALIDANEPQPAGLKNEEVDQAFTQTPEENTAEEVTSSESQANGDEESQEVNQAVAQTPGQNVLDGTSNTAIQGNGDEEPETSDSEVSSRGSDGMSNTDTEADTDSEDDEEDDDDDGEDDDDDGEDDDDDGEDDDDDGEDDDDDEEDDDDDGEDDDDDGEDDDDGDNEDRSDSREVKQNGRFFTLPHEIRLMIYGHCLRAKGIIQDKNRNRRIIEKPYIPNVKGQELCPQILATCRQIKAECGNMLYDDNTFHVTIEDYDRHFHQCRYECTLDSRIPPPQIFFQMKRIEVKIGGGLGVHHLDEAIETTARVLAHMPQIQYLSIQFTPGMAKIMRADRNRASFKEAHVQNTNFVQPLLLIQNIPQVEVGGVASNWQNYLIKQITSSSSPIPKMYWLLEIYANSIEAPPSLLPPACRLTKRFNEKYFSHREQDAIGIRCALGLAMRSAAQDDLEKFIYKRQRVIKYIDRQKRHATKHLFDHDVVQQKVQK